MTVPYSFGAATSAIPLSQLDSNFNTPITLGNTAIQLGNTVTTLNNMTLANVTISSGNVTITNVSVSTANVTTGNITNLISGNVAITGGNISNVTLTLDSLDSTPVGASSPSTGAFTTLSASSTVTLSGGTANGVGYLNGSKQFTTGSALTFDGSIFSVTNSSPTTTAAFYNTNASRTANLRLYGSNQTTYFLDVASGNSAHYIYGTGAGIPIIFGVDNAEGMRLTSTGLGIGTSSPNAKLHVVGSSGSGDVQIGTSSGANQYQYITFGGTAGGTDYGWQIGRSSNSSGLGGNGAFYWYDIKANATRMSIDSSGNLGLGVTPSAWNTFNRVLQVGGAALANYNNNDNTMLGSNVYYGTGFKYITSGQWATMYRMENGQHSWQTASAGNANDPITFIQAMTLDASGNLGLGITAPNLNDWTSGALGMHIKGASNYGVLKLESSDSKIAWLATGSSATYLFVKDANPLIFGTNNTERARIDSSGNLLVGKTSSGASTAGCEFGTYGAILTRSSGDALLVNRETDDGAAVTLRRSNVTVGTISVTTSATSYNTSSDYRLKDNQQPLTGSGAFIDALQPKTWEWKADGSKGVGFIAHEVQAVSPGSVVGEKDAVDDDGKPKYQAMEYGSAEFIANIVAELQSLRKRVAQLEGK